MPFCIYLFPTRLICCVVHKFVAPVEGITVTVITPAGDKHKDAKADKITFFSKDDFNQHLNRLRGVLKRDGGVWRRLAAYGCVTKAYEHIQIHTDDVIATLNSNRYVRVYTVSCIFVHIYIWMYISRYIYVYIHL